MIGVHKFLGIIARNKKYANFLITGRHGDGAYAFYFIIYSVLKLLI